MTRPRLLDLFCGAGGCSKGYHEAGFDVVGVDLAPQKRYPFELIQTDAMDYLDKHGKDYDAIHASPPCQRYSRLAKVPWIKIRADLHPMLIEPLREILLAISVPWVIENVEDAPLKGIMLCGRMFGLAVYRHRLFESSTMLLAPAHPSHSYVIRSGGWVNNRKQNPRKTALGMPQVLGVYRHQFNTAQGRIAMGIDWMSRDELRQAIPPAYTRFVGRQLIERLK